MLHRLFFTLILSIAAFAALPTRDAHADKLRDLCDVVGARENQLVGYGVVTGLAGTGDDVSAPFAMQSLRALLRRLGIQVDGRTLRLRNVAAVVVTTNIPPFARPGAKLDVTVSSIGNARSLRGGVLVQTPMRGADRKTYAVAQGPLVVGGFESGGRSGSSIQANITTTGRLPGGALVEREIPTQFAKDGKIHLALRMADFLTADRVAEALNKELGKNSARPLDGGVVELKAPKDWNKREVALIAKIGELEVVPSTAARVIINERTGTIVAGGDVRLLPVAISQGGITISVSEQPEASQPNVLAGGDTTVVDRSTIDVQEQNPPALKFVDGAATLADVAQALSTFGVTPRVLASILQALKAAGALRAEVVVQ
jgi:flagellar P-ring protein FlgI